jgi:hypothetical protein
MNWIDSAAAWFIGVATSPAAPYLLVAALVVVFFSLVAIFRAWLDLQDAKNALNHSGHVPPRALPDPPERITEPPFADAVLRTLGPDAGPHLAGRQVWVRRAPPPPAKDCCGACDGTKCGDKPPPSASTMTPNELRNAALRASLSAAPGRNPSRPVPTPSRPAAPAPAARRRDDDDDQPYQGSYYGQAASRAINDDPPAPAPSFRSGLGGDFGGAGASSSWDVPSKSCGSSTSSYDSGSSSSDNSCSDSGSSGGSSD